MRVDKLTFNAGSGDTKEKTVVHPSNITVFIGPNNGGKSAALREINKLFSGDENKNYIFSDIVIKDIDANEFYKKIDFLTDSDGDYLKKEQVNIGVRGLVSSLYGPSIKHTVDSFLKGTERKHAFKNFLVHYVLNLDGMNRLVLVNNQSSQRLNEKPKTTIAEVFKNDELRDRISSIVHDAFGRYILVDPTSMSMFQYALSDEKIDKNIERSFTDEAINFFERCTPISETSDGTKAFIGILTEIMAGYHEILLIDEPEAFLHPGLAYLLGSEVSKHIANEKQLFVATHSPHFLMGCMSIGVPVNIVRLTFKSGHASARVLPAAELTPMMQDPLLKSIGVMSALFFESAVLVEADSDRAFYEEINSRLIHYGSDAIRHTTFLNAHNKQEAAYIARVLRNLGIPAPMILDLDWIKEDGKVAKKYFDGAGIPEEMQSGLLETRRQVRAALEKISGGDKYKTTGGVSLLSGSALATANSFFDQMETFGLFTVRNGELESWLSSLGVRASKARWLGKIFQKMGNNPHDTDFVRPSDDDVWELIRSIGRWVKKVDRLGMTFVRPIAWIEENDS